MCYRSGGTMHTPLPLLPPLYPSLFSSSPFFFSSFPLSFHFVLPSQCSFSVFSAARLCDGNASFAAPYARERALVVAEKEGVLALSSTILRWTYFSFLPLLACVYIQNPRPRACSIRLEYSKQRMSLWHHHTYHYHVVEACGRVRVRAAW